MMKSFLAAAVLAFTAAAATPASAYDGDRSGKYGYGKTYSKSDDGHGRRGDHRVHREGRDRDDDGRGRWRSRDGDHYAREHRHGRRWWHYRRYHDDYAYEYRRPRPWWMRYYWN